MSRSYRKSALSNANSLIDWLKKQNVNTHHIKAGSPWQNAYAESFNATLRRECLNQELFHAPITAQIKRLRCGKDGTMRSVLTVRLSCGVLLIVVILLGTRVPDTGRISRREYESLCWSMDVLRPTRAGKGRRRSTKKEQTLYLPVVQT